MYFIIKHFTEQYRRTFQEQGKKIHKLYFRSMDDVTKYFKLFLRFSQHPYFFFLNYFISKTFSVSFIKWSI